MKPELSIVIDNFEQAAFLPAAIESALAQRGPRVEVIVVDDGSRDGSREQMDRYGDRILPVLKPNGGQASALNAGFAHCRADAVIFLDADDALLAGAAERALKSLSDPSTVKSHWPMWVIDEAGGRTGERIPDAKLPEGDRRPALLEQGPTSELAPPTSGNAWTRAFLEQVMPIPEELYRISADKHLLELAPFFGELRRVDEPLSLYRRHAEGSQVRADVEERLARELAFYDCYCQVIEEHLAHEGIRVDRELWKQGSWWHRQAAAIEALRGLPDPGGPLLLVDEGAWGSGPVAGRETLPFLERDGVSWGSPADDATAIRELERMRAAGAGTLVFVWSTFWWLEQYRDFRAHLERRYPQLLRDDNLVVFDLSRTRENLDA